MTTAKEPREVPRLSPDDALQLVEEIRQIGRGMREILTAGLQRKTLVVLLHESTGVPKRDINAVLDGLETFEADFLEKSKK
jgi:hypothetical protein